MCLLPDTSINNNRDPLGGILAVRFQAAGRPQLPLPRRVSLLCPFPRPSGEGIAQYPHLSRETGNINLLPDTVAAQEARRLYYSRKRRTGEKQNLPSAGGSAL